MKMSVIYNWKSVVEDLLLMYSMQANAVSHYQLPPNLSSWILESVWKRITYYLERLKSNHLFKITIKEDLLWVLNWNFGLCTILRKFFWRWLVLMMNASKIFLYTVSKFYILLLHFILIFHTILCTAQRPCTIYSVKHHRRYRSQHSTSLEYILQVYII